MCNSGVSIMHTKHLWYWICTKTNYCVTLRMSYTHIHQPSNYNRCVKDILLYNKIKQLYILYTILTLGTRSIGITWCWTPGVRRSKYTIFTASSQWSDIIANWASQKVSCGGTQISEYEAHNPDWRYNNPDFGLLQHYFTCLAYGSNWAFQTLFNNFNSREVSLKVDKYGLVPCTAKNVIGRLAQLTGFRS